MRMLGLILALGLVGCGGDDGESPGGQGGAGGTGGASGAAGAAGAAGGAMTLAEWTAGPSLAGARDHHATVAVNGFLFAMGGVRDMQTALSSVEAAAIGSDGSLGAWQAGAPLPAAVIGHTVAVVDDVIVLATGIRVGASGSGALSTASETARVMSDGTLSAWTSGPVLSESRFHGAATSWERWVYVSGGLTGAGKDNTPGVERAEVLSDGTLSAWVSVTPLPGKRSHHSIVAHDGALWVTGGLSGDPAGVHTSFSDVLRAPIMSDGSLGEWSVVSELPLTLATHASFVHSGALHVIGGVEGGSTNTAAVRRAAIGADGTLGAWEELPALPKARAHAHQTPVVGNFVYSVGGAFEHMSLSDVFIGRFESE